MSLDLDMIWQYTPLLFSGLGVTTFTCVAAAMIAVAGGLTLALVRQCRFTLLRLIAGAYTEIMRGTPVLVVLFLLYYGGPSLGLFLDPIPAGVVGLGLYSAGFFAEVFRAGFQSVPRGEIEAARMLGMGRRDILLQIQLPRMLALIVPPATNQFIVLIKESSLLSIITVAELTKDASRMANETFALVEPYLGVALLYWLLIETVAYCGTVVERRMRSPS